MSKRKGNGRGFTPAELLVVLAILASLVSMVAPNLAAMTGGARSQAAEEELDIVQSAFDTLIIEVGAITVAENLASGGVSIGPSTVITCYKHDGTTIEVPTGDHYLRLRTTSEGEYTWDREGLVRQASY